MLPRHTLKRQLQDVLARHTGQGGIVYCSSRREVEALAAWLRESGVRARPYHEYQHSILPRSAQVLAGRLSCTAGAFALPEGPGVWVAPATLYEETRRVAAISVRDKLAKLDQELDRYAV